MQNYYQNKVALVTGGTSGIGKATAIAFAEAGAKVGLSGRREKEGKEVVAKIEHGGGMGAFFQADFSKDAEVRATIDFVLATYGHLDVAFNNAGVESVDPLSEITEEKYRTGLRYQCLGGAQRDEVRDRCHAQDRRWSNC